jgi:hypothetical protein
LAALALPGRTRAATTPATEADGPAHTAVATS